jgi:hypothetical protein
MSELTTHPSLTARELGQGHITSKEKGTRAIQSSSNNREILERTAHSAVLPVSKSNLHAQRTGLDIDTLVDDVSISKKPAAAHEGVEVEGPKAQKEQGSQNHGGDSDSGSSSHADKLEAHVDESLHHAKLITLVTALKALTKADCRRVIDSATFDPSHAFANLWDQESSARLTSAATALAGFETDLQARLEGMTCFKTFETFVNSKHRNPMGKNLAMVLREAAEGFSNGQDRKISGFNPKISDSSLKKFFKFLKNEDHTLKYAQDSLVKRLNLIYLKLVIAEDQKSKKLDYRLEAAFKFSKIKNTNPFERLKESLLAKLGDDKKIKDKAKSFKETTQANLSSLAQKIVHAVAEFSNIFFSGLLSLLGDVNEKLGKGLESKSIAGFVRGGSLSGADLAKT